MLSRHNPHQLHPGTRTASGHPDRDVRMETGRVRHCLAEHDTSLLPPCLSPHLAWFPPPTHKLRLHPTLCSFSPWRRKRGKGKLGRTEGNRIVVLSPALLGDETRWGCYSERWRRGKHRLACPGRSWSCQIGWLLTIVCKFHPEKPLHLLVNMALNSGLTPPSPEIRVGKGSRAAVWSCSKTRWVPCLSSHQPPWSGLICDYLANVSPTWMHTAQEVQNTVPFRCVITGTYRRHRVHFPTQKISHCWESKFHITFLCKSDGKFGLGKFSHLKICKFTTWL